MLCGIVPPFASVGLSDDRTYFIPRSASETGVPPRYFVQWDVDAYPSLARKRMVSLFRVEVEEAMPL